MLLLIGGCGVALNIFWFATWPIKDKKKGTDKKQEKINEFIAFIGLINWETSCTVVTLSLINTVEWLITAATLVNLFLMKRVPTILKIENKDKLVEIDTSKKLLSRQQPIFYKPIRFISQTVNSTPLNSSTHM